MVSVSARGVSLLRRDHRQVLEHPVVGEPQSLPLRPSFFEQRHLREPECRLYIGHVVLEPRRDNFIPRKPLSKSRPGIRRDAVIREQLHAGDEFRVPADHHATVTGGDALGGIEAEAARITHQARRMAVICGLDGVGAVLDQLQTVLPRDLQDGIHVATASAQVHYYQGLGARGNSALDR